MPKLTTLGTAFVSVVALLLISSAPLPAACSDDPECVDTSVWSGFGHIILGESSPGSQGKITWDASFDNKTNDASIKIETLGAGSETKGTVALVGGYVMLSKGLHLEPGYEIDALDGPVLSIRMLLSVLSRVFPKGPSEISRTQSVDRTDSQGFKFATASAGGAIAPPWHVKGRVTKREDGSVTFDLALSFPTRTRKGSPTEWTTRMNGRLEKLTYPVFHDSDSLAGWKTYGIGPEESAHGGSTILEYGAKPDKSQSFKTIGDIRAFIAAGNSPGVKDASKDFTGFWKEHCSDAFGLQIMHSGKEGMYSVVFCGPGGCSDPAQSRLTYITGDQQYKVVSEDEIIEVGSSGVSETYHRCTKNPHPVLKYRH